MRHPRHIVTVAALLGMAGTSSAFARTDADGFSVSGSMRLRYEAIDGQARAGFNESDQLINLRTNVLGEYRAGHIRFAAELFDSRVWGDNSHTPVSTNDVNALEPVQAYVAADFANALGVGSEVTVAAGRMTVNLGSRRLVAADDYRNTASGYTGLRTDITVAKGWKAALVYLLPQVRLPDDLQGLRSAQVKLDKESQDLVLWGGVLSRANTLGPVMAELTYLRLDEKDAPGRPTRDRALDTFGGRLIADPHVGEFDYEIEAFHQTGEVSVSTAATALRQAVRANFVHADLGYSFDRPSKPHLSFEFDMASGDKPGGRYGRFDTLFGTRRAEFAPSGLYATVGRANLLAPGIRFEATPDKQLDWFVSYKPLWLAAAQDGFSTSGVRDASGNSGKFAGHQVEGRARYWIVPARLRFEFDGLLLAKGGFLRDAPNAPPGRWTGYGSVNLTASF